MNSPYYDRYRYMYIENEKVNNMRELFIAVDVETTGPIPGKYSMYEIGAVSVEFPDSDFEAKLMLLNDNYEPEALAATKTSIDQIRTMGRDPKTVMEDFERWILRSAKFHNARPVLVAINAPFDWMFVAWYFHTFLGRNPFGYSALDLKAYYAGKESCSWTLSNKRSMEARFGSILPHTHTALDDAKKVAEIFALMRHSKL